MKNPIGKGKKRQISYFDLPESLKRKVINRAALESTKEQVKKMKKAGYKFSKEPDKGCLCKCHNHPWTQDSGDNCCRSFHSQPVSSKCECHEGRCDLIECFGNVCSCSLNKRCHVDSSKGGEWEKEYDEKFKNSITLKWSPHTGAMLSGELEYYNLSTSVASIKSFIKSLLAKKREDNLEEIVERWGKKHLKKLMNK